MPFRKIFLLLAAIVLLLGCRRDLALDQEPEWSGPTPVSLQLPPWATADGHAPNLPYDNPLTAEGVALGRLLFYEKALSDNYTMSCGSCHMQEHAFSDPRQFSFGTDGSVGSRNAMAIVNLAWDHFFFWDARALSLELQALGPVVNHAEMRNTWPVVVERLQAHPEYPDLFRKAFGSAVVDSLSVVKAIAQFERTLVSFNSPFDRFHYMGDSMALTSSQKRGHTLFFGDAKCGDCHIAPLFNDLAMRDIGLDLEPMDEGMGGVTRIPGHRGQFKNVGLRNVARTAPYMHDGRFTTLDQVVDFYVDSVMPSPNLDGHMDPYLNGEVILSPQDRADLVSFMEALTDLQFLTNPAFSDPH